MKKNAWAAVLVAVLVAATPAVAGIEYEFYQKSSSDVNEIPPGELSGRALIDGLKSRVDFIGGNVYPPGTYMVSVDGARTLRFVDPLHKSYTEFNVASVAAAIGASSIKIANVQSSVTRLDDRPMIAGHPAEHYRLTLSYEITLVHRGRPLTQNVRTVIDRWTTTAFGDVAATLGGTVTHTGHAEVDELIALETTKIKGFPLKEVITITTGNSKFRSLPQMPAVRTQTRETVVTAVRELTPEPRTFLIPATYRKSEVEDEPKSQAVQVTLEPSGE